MPKHLSATNPKVFSLTSGPPNTTSAKDFFFYFSTLVNSINQAYKLLILCQDRFHSCLSHFYVVRECPPNSGTFLRIQASLRTVPNGVHILTNVYTTPNYQQRIAGPSSPANSRVAVLKKHNPHPCSRQRDPQSSTHCFQ